MQRTGFEIPEQMRRAADDRIAEARKAIEQVLEATEKALSQAAGSSKWMGEGAADVQRQAFAYLEENVGASFDLAQRLVHVRTVEELGAIQQEFVRRQMAAMIEQGTALGDMAMRAAAEMAAKPKK
ncbi:MAG TPA: phasin family protein [Edaphobacter sp.]|nr:phasin family protein [Bauldia sp.]HZY74187.1 phasin family protein [Edaphobacter sp.]